MKQQPLVSIISGYYNREDFVDDSIQSLIDQTYQNTEIIIFDDCSTDKTYDKLVAIANTDSRIRLIRNLENKGFVRSLIDAVESAKGEYIAIHGSGDFSYPTRIEKQVHVLNSQPNIGVVGTFVENINVSGANESRSLMQVPINGNAISQLEKRNIFTHGEVMFRKGLHDMVGGYRSFFKFTQDYDLWSRLSTVCDFHNVPEVLYKRYLRSDGATVDPEKRLYQALLAEVVCQNFKFIKLRKPDLVDQFGENTFSNLGQLSEKGTNNLYSRILNVFLENKKNSHLSKQAIMLFAKKSNKKVTSIILFGLFFLIPKPIGLRIMQLPKFRVLLDLTFSKLK
ncbi:putative glycosyltransferase EpsE [compost metagenome]